MCSDPARAQGSAAAGRLRLAVGIGLDARGRLSLYCGIIQTAISPASIVRLTSAVGRLDSADGPDGLEFRLWAPYRVEDLRLARREAAVWVASAVVAAARALGFAAPPPVPTVLRGVTVARPAGGQSTRDADGAPAASDTGSEGQVAARELEAPAVSPQADGRSDTALALAEVDAAEDVETVNEQTVGDGEATPAEPAATQPADNDQIVEGSFEGEAETEAAPPTVEVSAQREDRVALVQAQTDIRELIQENRQLTAYLRDLAERAMQAGGGIQSPADWDQRLRDVTEREASAVARANGLGAENMALRLTLADSEAQLAKITADRQRLPEDEVAATDPAGAYARLVGLRDLLMRDPLSVDEVRAKMLVPWLDLQPEDSPVRETLAASLLSLGDVQAAVDILAPVIDVLTPVGAARHVEATLRGRSVPAPRALERADWTVGLAATEFRKTPTWMRSPDLVVTAQAVVGNWPPGAAAWLEEVTEALHGVALKSMFDVWCQFDEALAGGQLVSWVADGKASPHAEDWCREGLELVAIESVDRKVAVTGFHQALEAFRRLKDWPSVSRLLDRARNQLSARDWIALGTEAALADLQGSPARQSKLPALLEELLGLSEVVKVRGEQMELMAAAREALRILPPELTAGLRARIDGGNGETAVGPDSGAAAVTTVYEALAYARDRYPALVILKEAEDSARQRGSAGTRQALESMTALGDWAQRYAEDDSQETWERLRLLPGFREDVSATARQQHRRHYDRRLDDGSVIQLGPHLDAGGGGGRLYFCVDQARRKVIVGHVGRHLPGKRDV